VKHIKSINNILQMFQQVPLLMTSYLTQFNLWQSKIPRVQVTYVQAKMEVLLNKQW